MTAETATAFEGERPQGRRTPLLARYGKFLLVGLTGVVVNLAVFALALDAISPHPTFDLYANLRRLASTGSSGLEANLAASAVAFAVATLWNFTFNNLWTFRTAVGHRHPLGPRVGLYYGVSLGSLGVNEGVLAVASLVLAPLWGQGIGILAGSIVGFVGNRQITFAEAGLPT